MKTSEILQPLFEIVCKIHCDTDIELDFGVKKYTFDTPLSSGEKGFKKIYWYVGDCVNPAAGSYDDDFDVDDLDEDKLNDWVDQLTALYDEAMGIEDTDENEESREDIARYENRRIDMEGRS